MLIKTLHSSAVLTAIGPHHDALPVDGDVIRVPPSKKP